MAADEVLVLNLFDSIWFGHEIVSTTTKVPSQEPEPEPEYIDTNDDNNLHVSFSAPSINVIRSLSDHDLMVDSKSSFFSTSSSDSLSPSSVLAAPKLQTIFSGKEVKCSADDIHKEEEVKTTKQVDGIQEEGLPKKHEKKVNERLTRSRRRASSKSLSELEFEELQGFMDLGFVFTEEECKDSKLVSMIPGLQRLCKTCTEKPEETETGTEKQKDVHGDLEKKIQSRRPYLSEVWDVRDLEHQRKSKKEMNNNNNNKTPLMNWKIPTLVADIEMKDQLRFWAHTVASTVR